MKTEHTEWLWRKSSYSNAESNCVEVAAIESAITAVRDSKDLRVGRLTVPAASWATFTSTLTT